MRSLIALLLLPSCMTYHVVEKQNDYCKVIGELKRSLPSCKDLRSSKMTIQNFYLTLRRDYANRCQVTTKDLQKFCVDHIEDIIEREKENGEADREAIKIY